MLDLAKTISLFTSFSINVIAATIFIVVFLKKRSAAIKQRKDLKAKEAKIKEDLYKAYLKNENKENKSWHADIKQIEK